MKNKQFTQSEISAPREPKIIEKVVVVEQSKDRPIHVELNFKRFKALIVLSNLLFVLSVFLFFFTFSETGTKLMSHEVGFSIMLVAVPLSFVIHGIGKFLMWWNNG